MDKGLPEEDAISFKQTDERISLVHLNITRSQSLWVKGEEGNLWQGLNIHDFWLLGTGAPSFVAMP